VKSATFKQEFKFYHIQLITPTPWSRILIEKLIVTQLPRKFPAFCETQRFVTVFTTARGWCLS